ncbi:hypothetical protein IV203_032060 [Nitzschia inconspicua]|uniref:Uncharacterized protein n=1 Tax=Nitzschia inconspicua TaxID=303405 RepID=A0A9K3LW02_9STRA|nr:hypothetical protein IV203_032060 [Nitzschia inconspicua]
MSTTASNALPASSSATALTYKDAAGGGSKNNKTPESQGCLEATVLSVYDLPFAERPVAVTVSSCGITVKSGPPVARHKDRNSYRFATGSGINGSTTSPTATSGGSSSSRDTIKVIAPLRQLYKSMLTLRVVFADPNTYLETELPLRQLRIHENKWLILNLTPTPASPPANTSNAITPSSGSITSATTSLPDEDSMAPPPTIRIKLKLSGPYRPEVAALVGLAQAWFGLVDKMEDGTKSSLQKVPTLPSQYNKFLLIPAVPVVAGIVVVSPVVAGIAMVGLPLVLPVVLVAVAVLTGVLLSGGVLYSSTRSGRAQVGGTFAPILEHLLGSRPGQALVYDTGPRPTPVSVCRQILPRGMWSRLFLSLLIDLIGSSSYLLPVVGEGLDLAWAPAQTILIMAMYDATSPNLKYVSFLEELLPFTDIVPSATIGWACEFVPGMLNNNSNNVVPPEMKQAVTQLVSKAASAASGTSTTQS